MDAHRCVMHHSHSAKSGVSWFYISAWGLELLVLMTKGNAKASKSETSTIQAPRFSLLHTVLLGVMGKEKNV